MTDDDQVRRLLAEARHDEPLPEDVATRLDEVLAGLRDDRPVVDLAARQRRKHVRTWVLAAAAVVVVGIGINQVEWSGMTTGDDSADSGAASSPELESGAGDAAEAPADGARRDAYVWRKARAQLKKERFAVQAASLQTELPRATLSSAAESDLDADGGSYQYDVLCEFAPQAPGRVVSVTYDGERGWLVYRDPQGDSQVVDLYLCGRSKPTRSITLPAP